MQKRRLDMFSAVAAPASAVHTLRTTELKCDDVHVDGSAVAMTKR